MRPPKLPKGYVADDADRMPARSASTDDLAALSAFEEVSAVIRNSRGDSEAALENAWRLLEQYPAALGVTAPIGHPGGGYALIHTCLCRLTPDWFIMYLLNRTPITILVGAQFEKLGERHSLQACADGSKRIRPPPQLRHPSDGVRPAGLSGA